MHVSSERSVVTPHDLICDILISLHTNLWVYISYYITWHKLQFDKHNIELINFLVMEDRYTDTYIFYATRIRKEDSMFHRFLSVCGTRYSISSSSEVTTTWSFANKGICRCSFSTGIPIYLHFDYTILLLLFLYRP